MAMAMAMTAYTELSMPLAVPASTTVAGPVSADSAISCTGRVVGAGVVLGEAADALGQDEADGDGAEALPAGVVLVVADVEQGDEQRADERERAGDEEAAVDRLEGVGLALLGLHGEHADDRGDDADGAGGEREHEAERRVRRRSS